MEGGKWVYKGGHVEVSGSSKLPPGFHMKGGKIVYGHGSHTMSLPEGSFHSQGGHVVFSDASGAAGSASVSHTAHGGGTFSHTETFGDMPPGFKMEGGKMVYSKSGHFDFSGDGKLPPGFHMKGGKVVYGHGSHAMSFPESDFHSQGGHVVFSDASGAAGSASVSHTAHGGGTFSHTETFGDMPPGFKMEGGKMVYSKSGHFDFSGDGKLPPGFHMKGGKVVYGHGSHAMSFPESDFHSQGGHVVFNTGQKH